MARSRSRSASEKREVRSPSRSSSVSIKEPPVPKRKRSPSSEERPRGARNSIRSNESDKKLEDRRKPSREGEKKRGKSRSKSRSRSRRGRSARDRSNARSDRRRPSNRSRPRSANRTGRDGDAEGCSVLVRQIDYRVSPDEVRRHFATVGPVRDVYLPLEFRSSKPKGFGFVAFVHAADAKEAVRELNDSKLGSMRITCTIAQDRRKSPRAMGKLTAGSGYPRWEEDGRVRRGHWAENIVPRSHLRDSRRR